MYSCGWPADRSSCVGNLSAFRPASSLFIRFVIVYMTMYFLLVTKARVKLLLKILQTVVSDLFVCLSWQYICFLIYFCFPSLPVIWSKRQAVFPLHLKAIKNLSYDFFLYQPLKSTSFRYIFIFLICLFLCLKSFFPFLSSFSILPPHL